MANKKKIAGHRKRPFRPRSIDVPAAVHVIMEFVYDMCLELGICPACKLRPLHQKGSRTFNQCEECLSYDREWQRKNGGKKK